jgi:WhiB family redox-sensing transcriptional regulator
VDLSWRKRGACRGMDPDLWYPEMGATSREGKRICAGCPVREECLEYALAKRERFGIWGGESERARRRILRRRNGAYPKMARAPRPRKQAG